MMIAKSQALFVKCAVEMILLGVRNNPGNNRLEEQRKLMRVVGMNVPGFNISAKR